MKKYIALVAMGCERENIDNTPIVDDSVMRIEALHPSTRATETSFENSDVIGLYATTYEGEQAMPLQISGNWINNEALTYNGSSWKGRRTFYWNEGLMDVYGYYPYMEPTVINKHKWAVQTDQSLPATEGALSAYEASDFLWAKAEGVSQEDAITETTSQPTEYEVLRANTIAEQERASQVKLERVLDYTKQTMVAYMSEAELDRLCGYITEYSLGDTPREVSPVSVDSALKSIDLMHFGWNIGKAFGK